MRVFLLPEDASRTGCALLRGEDYHYLARVRRLKEGDEFQGADAAGDRWVCRVVRVGRSYLEARLEQSLGKPTRQGPPISLLQVLPKGRKMDTVVRQATEAGVDRIVPVLGRNSMVRLDGEGDVQTKLRRWRRIAREAVQQSGAVSLPEVQAPLSLTEAVGEAEAGEARLVFHQERRGAATLHGCLAGDVRALSVVIGPEGGLAEEELEFLLSMGFVPVTVGATVLRTETAAVFALAAIQTILEERQAWQLLP